MLKLSCQHFGFTKDNIPEKYAGKTVKCPKCKEGGVRIPDIELELDESMPETQAQAPIAKTPDPVNQMQITHTPVKKFNFDLIKSNSKSNIFYFFQDFKNIFKGNVAPKKEDIPSLSIIPPLWNPCGRLAVSFFNAHIRVSPDLAELEIAR